MLSAVGDIADGNCGVGAGVSAGDPGAGDMGRIGRHGQSHPERGKSVKENVYVEAARSIGAKNATIILRHVLPNIMAELARAS